jgi:hypothetical protein
MHHDEHMNHVDFASVIRFLLPNHVYSKLDIDALWLDYKKENGCPCCECEKLKLYIRGYGGFCHKCSSKRDAEYREQLKQRELKLKQHA